MEPTELVRQERSSLDARERPTVWLPFAISSKGFSDLPIEVGMSNDEKKTSEAEAAGTSNCPICAQGHESNQAKIWKFEEMDADHISAWSKGGSTSADNCQMLCVRHNRAKGNR